VKHTTAAARVLTRRNVVVIKKRLETLKELDPNFNESDGIE
jgi:hypothetical protein